MYVFDSNYMSLDAYYIRLKLFSVFCECNCNGLCSGEEGYKYGTKTPRQMLESHDLNLV